MNQNKGLKRNTIDKFYTKKDIVKLCINEFKNIININEDDLIIEPSAGNGSFINIIETFNCNKTYYDIEPENDKIIKQDYLKLDYKDFNYNKIHLIGNPPFGRQSSMVLKFIKYSSLFCDSFSFILPKSFKKDSYKNKIDLYFHLIKEIDLPKNSFTINNIDYDVPCVFQIWIKKNKQRIIQDKLKPLNFIFVKKNENPDISFRRVGVYAGKIDKDINKNEQSHYFIKFTNNKSLYDNYELLKNVIFEHDNTVGPKSISKQELIYKYNQILK